MKIVAFTTNAVKLHPTGALQPNENPQATPADLAVLRHTADGPEDASDFPPETPEFIRGVISKARRDRTARRARLAAYVTRSGEGYEALVAQQIADLVIAKPARVCTLSDHALFFAGRMFGLFCVENYGVFDPAIDFNEKRIAEWKRSLGRPADEVSPMLSAVRWLPVGLWSSNIVTFPVFAGNVESGGRG